MKQPVQGPSAFLLSFKLKTFRVYFSLIDQNELISPGSFITLPGEVATLGDYHRHTRMFQLSARQMTDSIGNESNLAPSTEVRAQERK